MNEHFIQRVEALKDATQVIVAGLEELLYALANDGHNPKFDGFDDVIVPNACRHGVPVGDWCSYCAETPEG